MARPETTDIIKTPATGPGNKEVTKESHPSWLMVGISRVSSGPPGRHLFDSDIGHQHFVRLTVSTAERERDLNHDWKHARRRIMEIDFSEQQWGAVVSSSNVGSGTPGTLAHFNPLDLPVGMTPEAPHEPRLAESFREVKEAGARAMERVLECEIAVQEAFEQKLGVRVMRERLKSLRWAIEGVPGNMEFAAKSLAEHAENVTLKIKGDIEAMAQSAMMTGQPLQLEDGLADKVLGITAGEVDDEDVTDVEVIEPDA